MIFIINFHNQFLCKIVVVSQVLSCVQLFATPRTAACQTPLSGTISWSLLKFTSIEWWCYLTVSSSATPFSFRLQSFPVSGSFPLSQPFASSGQSTGTSASASVLPLNSQSWFRIDCFVLLAFQGILKSSPTTQFKRIVTWGY